MESRDSEPQRVGLTGLRVLDLGRYIAAPFCAQMLANEGAEVIRVEPPEGATDREVMPVGISGRGGLYLQVNNNKKSLTLDYARPEGRAVLEDLIRTADVLVVNLPGNALKKLRLDYETLRQIKPDLILTTISAFDPEGESRDKVGFDGTGQALSGAMYLTGAGERPYRASISYVDYATAMSAAFATMAALLERRITGQGQHVQCSLLGTAMTMMNPMLMEEASGFRSRRPIGNRSPIAGPSDLFRTKDGWIMVQVIGDVMFKRWAEFIGKPELVGDPRFATDSDRGENGEVLSAILAEWCAERSADECLAALAERRLPACRCLSPVETLELDAFRDYVEPIPLDGAGKTVPLVTRSVLTAMTGRNDRLPAPHLGADTAEILGSVGIDTSEMDRLRAAGTI
ncbi:MAG: CoA transferase [Amaricoccus sp.]|uniref:CaiB/BaiF CoA transferase family protein n=1 Tax=Amaricoccus sp. TaxID=1872485 RepID=UPI0039E68781